VEQPEPPGRYAPSWVDWLTDRIDRLPIAAWLAYAGVFIVLLLMTNMAGWLDGRLPIGSFDAYLSSLAVYPIAALAGIHYLDAEARGALEQLRPMLSVDDDEFITLRYRLTTLPANATIIWTLIGLAFAVAYIVLGLASSLRLRGPAVLAVDTATALVGFPLLAVLLFHTVRQLRLISRIQGRMARIDVFQLDPLLAFSRVTARNGLIILGLGYLSAATEPSTFTFENPTLIAFVAISILTAVAAFVLPMYGMHRRIADEKARLVAEANRDLQASLAEVSRRARSGDLTDADALNKQLSSLVIQRDVITRIPSWPWQPATFRGFATAILLPIALWLVFRALDRLIA
jgi:hypothetical protein